MLAKIKQHKKLTITVSIVLILAMVIGGICIKNSFGGSDDPGYDDMGVQAMYVNKQDLSASISAAGTVESASVVDVTTEVTSQITQLNVSLGDHVEKGDVLCVFDDKAIRQQIAELQSQSASASAAQKSQKQRAQAQLDAAKSQKNAAAVNYNNAKNAWDALNGQIQSDPSIAQQQPELLSQLMDLGDQVSQFQAIYQDAEAAVLAAQESLDGLSENAASDDVTAEIRKLQEQLNELTITAEQSGIITSLNVSKGSIPSGSLMKIEDDSNLQVTVSIKEKDILKLSQGMKARIRCDALQEENVYNGTVSRVINFATAGSSDYEGSSGGGGYSATIALEPGTPLLLGMSVKVEIILNEAEEQLAVPYDAIAEDGEGNSYIYRAVEAEDGKYLVERVDVTTGDSNDYYTAVTGKELQEGDLVISYPQDVSEGDQVELYIPEDEEL